MSAEPGNKEQGNVGANPAGRPASANLHPATGAVVGTSVIVLLVELARSGALEQYREVMAPLFSWGPGILILGAFIWLARSYAPLFIRSQTQIAESLSRLATSVESSSAAVQASRDEQRETIFTLQLLAKKIEELKADVREIADGRPAKTA
jgi:hypothetical protein